MKIREVEERTPRLVEQLVDVWEASVRATHLFLSANEIAEIKRYVPQALMGVAHLVVAARDDGAPAAFMGVQDGKLEMLFLAPEERGKGLGRLTSTARTHLDELEYLSEGSSWSMESSGMRSNPWWSTSRTPRPGTFMSTWGSRSLSGRIWMSREIPIRFFLCACRTAALDGGGVPWYHFPVPGKKL